MLTISLVGRSNVGKSTLFNYLTQSRRALVMDASEITRDYQYGQAHWQGYAYNIIDTGGLALSSEVIAQETEKKALQVLEKSQIVLFVVDAQEGCSPYDRELACKLRTIAGKVYLVANKIDRLASHLLCADFYSVGLGTPWPISAKTGRGVESLLENIFKDSVEHRQDAPIQDTPEATAITFFGRPNVGKSTLINRMVREERLIVSDIAGTTRDSIEVTHKRKGRYYTLVDTAGIRRNKQIQETIEKFSIAKTWAAVSQSDVVIMLIDMAQGISEQDKRLVGMAIKKGAGLIVAFNKTDLCSVDQQKAFKAEIDRKLVFLRYAQFCFVSGLYGKGLTGLYKAIDAVSDALSVECTTPQITRLLEEAVQQHPPPMEKGRRIKMRYAHIVSRKPFKILVHGKQMDDLPKSYIRYLSHYFHKALKLTGVFVHVEVKSDKNPYQ